LGGCVGWPNGWACGWIGKASPQSSLYRGPLWGAAPQPCEDEGGTAEAFIGVGGLCWVFLCSTVQYMVYDGHAMWGEEGMGGFSFVLLFVSILHLSSYRVFKMKVNYDRKKSRRKDEI
jgi:hypothetical protein